MIRKLQPATALIFAAVLAAFLLAGCASGPATSPRAGEPTGPSLSSDEMALAVRLHARLDEEHAAGNHRAALRMAHELMDHYRPYPELDAVALTAARSASALGDPDEALRLTSDYLASDGAGERRREVYELRADIFEADEDWARSADALVRAHDAAGLARDRERASGRLDALVSRLEADELRGLREAHPSSSLRPYLSFLWIRSLVSAERGAEAHAAYGDIVAESPEDPWTANAQQLLEGVAEHVLSPVPGRVPEGEVNPLGVGVLVPLTGRYTVLGNAFYDGVRLARDRAGAEGWRQYELNVRDSEGDPVTAALAMRRFVQEDKPLAVVGGLLSAPTVAAALTAESFGMPLVSPTATNLRIWELGPYSFQTNVTGLFESRLLARLAVQVMLKHRIGILHPDDAEGLRRAQVFADAVMDLGGDVVAMEGFNPGLTDFRDPLKRLGETLPEVIYVPAGPDEMMILGPQLDFYRAGALVLGPSEWNSPRLAREVGSILSRAVFPSDAALYPAEWSAAFDAGWDPGELPPEATAIAKQAYLAASLLFRSIGDSGAESRRDLRRALGERLELRRETGTDGEAMAASLRMFLDGKIVPFPMELFAEALAREVVDVEGETDGSVEAEEAAAEFR